MNRKQMEAAKEAMAEWLAHPAELGHAPAKIECAREFDLYDLHYYIFKYKKNLLGKWLLGVCGGYEGNDLEHCGHVFSEMEEYDEAKAVEQASALVESMRSYWMEQAEQAEKQKENAGTFVDCVLFKEAKWDKEALLRDLKETWGIEDEPDEAGGSEGDGAAGEAESDDDDVLVISCQGTMLAVSMMPGPVPNGEAEEAAAKNFMWPEGVERVKSHGAHLLVTVMRGVLSPLESGRMLVMAAASACKQEGALGVYTGDVVYDAEQYLRFSDMLKEGQFPILNLVWVGLYNGKKGICGYTGGMRRLGYDEMEVVDSHADAETLHGFLLDIVGYVINENVILRDGETIGFSAEQKLPISRSRGIAVEGESLKIGF